MEDIALVTLIRLRREIANCMREVDAHGLLDVGIGLDKAYDAIDALIVDAGGASVEPPALPEQPAPDRDRDGEQ